MDSRERTMLALAHSEPDRIPVDFWATQGVKSLIKKNLGFSFDEFLDANDVDIRYIEGPVYKGPPLTDSGNSSIDIWGVKRSSVNLKRGNACEIYKEVSEYPLAAFESCAQIYDYQHWPSPDWFDYSTIRTQCIHIREKGCASAFMGDRLNRIAQLKPAMYLRGTEQIFMDMAINEDIACVIFSKIREFYMKYTERILESAGDAIDIIVTGDDFGAQNGLLVSPDMWNRFLRAGFADYLGLIHAFGCKSMHHTCGSVYDLIPCMIECGLDILQSLQPEAANMDIAMLKKEFGESLCFQGGISIQKTMPFGTTDDVYNEVKRTAEIMGKNGGYIFGTAHNLQLDTPLENIQALLKAYSRYGP